jgi:hypothetical protein
MCRLRFVVDARKIPRAVPMMIGKHQLAHNVPALLPDRLEESLWPGDSGDRKNADAGAWDWGHLSFAKRSQLSVTSSDPKRWRDGER